MPKPSQPTLAAKSAPLGCAAHRLRSACASPFAFAVPTTLQLSKVAMSRLRQRAEAIGVDEAELVTKLLEVIAQDDLFDAVLDTAKGAA